MKKIKLFAASFLLFAIAQTGFAQDKTEKIKVSGECGMCKKKIESAAKNAGASYALWNKDSKVLTVKYNSTSSDRAKIEQSVADAGYDTQDIKATDAAYHKLDDCCQYDRTTSTDKHQAKSSKKSKDDCSDDCKKKASKKA